MTRRAILTARVLSVVGIGCGLLLLVLSTQPLVAAKATVLDRLGYPKVCTAWHRCPGEVGGPIEWMPDGVPLLPWCLGAAALVAMLLPILSRSGRGRAVLWAAAIGVWSALLLALRLRTVGFEERNHQYGMHPTWAWYAAMAVELVVIILAAAVAGINKTAALRAEGRRSAAGEFS